jgi:uncharacterized protein
MAAAEERLLEALVGEDAELAHIVHEHQQLDKELNKLQKRRYLTPNEEVEKKDLQVRKLARKDRIQRILTQYRNNERVIF